MRRTRDDWVNATQILKAAKYAKAHRTRILEKEVQNGTHEKIRGGYGRFQGTWIPLSIARPFAHKYGITDEMAPILAYVPDPNNPLQKRTKGKVAPPVNDPNDVQVKKPRKQYNTKKRREAAAAEAAASTNEQNSIQPANDIKRAQTVQPLPPINKLPPNDSNFWNAPNQQYPPNSAPAQLPNLQPPPQLPQFKNMSNSVPYQQRLPPYPNAKPGYQPFPVGYPPQYPPQMQSFHQQLPPQPEPLPYQQHRSRGSQENWSQDDGSTHMDEVMKDSDTSVSSEHSVYNDSKLRKVSYTEALIDFFSHESNIIPQALCHPPNDFDFNEPIDDEGHTPLHWASSMASLGLIDLLLKNGADPLVPNSSGLSSISRSIFFNNSYQKKNFPVIVERMKSCLYTPDKQGRTPLHYLAASNSSKFQIAKYYAEVILDRLSKENGNLVKVVANHRDINGQTALELAQQSNNKAILEVLKPYIDGIKDEPEKANRTASFDKMEDSILISPCVPQLPLKEVGPILTSMLSSLADAYDTELKNKEEESKHTESVLAKLQTDIKETDNQNSMILSQLDNGNSDYEELQTTVKELEDSCAKKADHLNNILERGQALNLAKLVLKEESALSQEQTGNDDDMTKYKLACKLTQLQLKRNKMIDRIINGLTTRNINNKMNNYRRLISVSCGLKTESIDELIDEIEADLLTTVSTIE